MRNGDGEVGTPELAAPGLWHLALPSRTLPPFTTTNSYLICDQGVAMVADPGSDSRAGFEALVRGLEHAGTRLVKGVLLTHAHDDHWAGLDALRSAFPDTPVYLHPAELGRLGDRPRLVALQGERSLTVGNLVVRTVFTPGHSPGHLSFHLPEQRAVLVGDLVAGSGSSWVGLPDGDVGHYLTSLRTVRELDPEVLGPGHGPLIDLPSQRLEAARAHRLERERQLLTELGRGPGSLTSLGQAIYPDLSPALLPAAERSLLAHLKKLMNEMRVVHLGSDHQGPYRLRQ